MSDVVKKKVKNLLSVLGLLAVLCVGGFFALDGYIESKYPDQADLYVERYSSAPLNEKEYVEKEKMYLVSFEMEDFGLSEEDDLKDFFVGGWGSEFFVRGSLVSINPYVESLDVGEAIIFGTEDSRFMLLQPGEFVAMSCELEREQVCVGKGVWESCAELILLEECVLSEILQ